MERDPAGGGGWSRSYSGPAQHSSHTAASNMAGTGSCHPLVVVCDAIGNLTFERLKILKY